MTTLPEDFFRPAPPLTVSLLKVGGRLPEEGEQQLPQPLLVTAQEDIALRLWGGLAGLARAYTVARGEESCALSISHIYPELVASVCRRLGLPKNNLANEVVWQDLLPSFFSWLEYERRGVYPAAWGVMHYDGSTLSFTDVHIPRYLAGSYRKAESTREGRRRRKEVAYAE